MWDGFRVKGQVPIETRAVCYRTRISSLEPTSEVFVSCPLSWRLTIALV